MQTIAWLHAYSQNRAETRQTAGLEEHITTYTIYITVPVECLPREKPFVILSARRQRCGEYALKKAEERVVGKGALLCHKVTWRLGRLL
jgi:hypothetical protein